MIIATTVAIIFHSLPDKESIAMTEKGRVLGISEQKIIIPLAIIIKDDEQEWRGVSELTETKDIIKDLQVPLYPEDLVSAFPDPKLKLGTTITIDRAPIIILNDGLEKLEMRSWQKTVADFLTEKNISLGPLDKLSPALESTLKNKDNISIIRIGERDEQVEETISFQKIEKPAPEMYKGERRLKQKGSDGKRVKTFRLHYENNVLTARNLIKEEIMIEAKNEIILVGTKPKITVRCRFNDIVEEASAKYGVDPNALCRTMMCESNGNPNSGFPDGLYQGLFQYNPGLWVTISVRAGFAGASIWDPRAQIFATAWAWTHGYSRNTHWINCAL